MKKSYKSWDDNPDTKLDLNEYTREELIEMVDNCFEESEYLHERIEQLEWQLLSLEKEIAERDAEILLVLKKYPFSRLNKFRNL